MGNRAVITTDNPSDRKADAMGVYLHWNGGAESVMAFLHAARDMGVRHPASDPQYGYAGLVTAIGLYFAKPLSYGVGPLRRCDVNNGNNGTFILDPTEWEIAKRVHVPSYLKKAAATRVEQLTPDERAVYDAIKNTIVARWKTLQAQDGDE